MDGIYYIATGEELKKEAMRSINSVRKSMPDIPITVATDSEFRDSDKIDNVINVDDPDYSFLDKVQYMKRSPYDKTLFLDCDTYITEPINDLFQLLGRFDMAATQAGYRRIQFHPHQKDIVATNKIPISYPEFNNGVVLFQDSDKIDSLLSDWERIYRDHISKQPKVGTQPAFLEAVYDSAIDIGTLPPEYNCHAQYVGTVSQPVKVVHTHASNIESVANKLNEHPDKGRTYIPCYYKDTLGLIMVYDGSESIDSTPSTLKWRRRLKVLETLIIEKGPIQGMREVLYWLKK